FLSASIPYGPRAETYRPDPFAVREAVRALVAETVPRRPLVFGGHPAISPLVWEAANSLNATENVYIYQSMMFWDSGPPEALFFASQHRLVWVPAVPLPGAGRDGPYDLDASLDALRKKMIWDRTLEDPNSPPLPPFAAGVFLGGMNGVEVEWDMF